MSQYIVVGRGTGRTMTMIQHMIDNTELEPFQITLIEGLKEHAKVMDAVIELVSEIWEVVKVFARNIVEKFVILLSREDSKTIQALRIYKGTKNKRIKKKKFKQLIGYLVDEFTV